MKNSINFSDFRDRYICFERAVSYGLLISFFFGLVLPLHIINMYPDYFSIKIDELFFSFFYLLLFFTFYHFLFSSLRWRFVKIFCEGAPLVFATYLGIRIFILPVETGVLNEGLESLSLDQSAGFTGSVLLILVIGLACFILPMFFARMVWSGLIFSVGAVLWGIATTPDSGESSVPEEFTNLARVSHSQNVFVLSFDGISADAVEKAVESSEVFRTIFKDFTIFPNASSFSGETEFSLLSTSISRELPAGVQGQELQWFFKNIVEYPEPLTGVMTRNGFLSDVLHLNCNLASGSDCFHRNAIFNAFDAHFRVSETGFSVGDIVLLRSMPAVVAKQLMSISQLIPIDMSFRGDGFLGEVRSDPSKINYPLDHLIFDDLFVNSLEWTDLPVFKFHHYLHSHSPIRIDSNCSFQLEGAEEVDVLICISKSVDSLIRALKDSGVFDRSMIFVVSDHGGVESPADRNTAAIPNIDGHWSPGKYTAMLIFKDFNKQQNAPKINRRPVSLLDIAPTIYDRLNIDECVVRNCDGVSLLEPRDVDRDPRHIMVYKGGPEQVNLLFNTTEVSEVVPIDGNGVVFDQISRAMDQFDRVRLSNIAEVVPCGVDRKFNVANPIPSTFTGFKEVNNGALWSVGEASKIVLRPNCEATSISLTLVNGNVERKLSTVLIRINNWAAHEFAMDWSYGTKSVKELSILDHVKGQPVSLIIETGQNEVGISSVKFN